MKKKFLKKREAWKNSRNPLLKLIYHIKKRSNQKKKSTIHHEFNTILKRDFSIVPAVNLPQKKVPDITQDYQKKAIADLYARMSASNFSCIQKSKQKDSFSR